MLSLSALRSWPCKPENLCDCWHWEHICHRMVAAQYNLTCHLSYIGESGWDLIHRCPIGVYSSSVVQPGTICCLHYEHYPDKLNLMLYGMQPRTSNEWQPKAPPNHVVVVQNENITYLPCIVLHFSPFILRGLPNAAYCNLCQCTKKHIHCSTLCSAVNKP